MSSRKAFLWSGLLALAPLLAAALDGSAGGVRWLVPAGWTAQPPRQMRAATYSIPAKAGGEPGECGVFYFGQRQGGSASENIERWGTQFEGAPPPATAVETVDGMRVHRAQTSGTYLSPGGPMMQSQGKKPGYRLMGAIVEGPQGLVFFKCTGPAAAISAAQPAFDSLVRSLKKSSVTKV
ncbi:MAG: hypothetical protein LC796_04665 [Acidobacteria bacterium]|nr:hypothetical protein [Acidobacteriota bacterium]MCA1609689.1 hypothetical protein [Acidobacteriota bacterium]